MPKSAFSNGFTSIDAALQSAVETVLVGGDILTQDGKLVGPHIADALEAMRATQRRLRPSAKHLLP
jgi:hypothetical protein